MSRMYKDAVIEAQKLRELAEQNAKNKILEAITPRIKRLIEQELLDDEEEDVPAEVMDDVGDDMGDDMGVEDSYELPDIAPLALDPQDSLSDLSDEMAAPADDLVGLDLDDAMGLESDAPTEFSFEKDGKQVKVSVTVEGKKSDKVLNVSPKVLKSLGGRKYKLRENSLGFLIASLNEAKTNKKKRLIINEIQKIRKQLIVMTEAGDKSSAEKLKALNFLLKESTEMSRTNRRSRRLSDRAWWLNEQDDIEGGDEIEGLDDEMDAEDAEGGDEEMVAKADVVDAVAAILDIETSDLEDLAMGEEAEGDEEEDEDDEELDLDEFAFFEADKDEMKDGDDKDEMMETKDEQKDEMKEEDEQDEMKEEDEQDEMMEISESMLRREIARMSRNRRRSSKKLSESARRRRARLARRRRLAEDAPVAGSGASSYGGGDAGDEPFIEVDEDTLLNALAEELGEISDGGGDANAAQEQYGGAGEVGSVDLEGSALAMESRRRRRSSRRLQIAEANARKAQKRAQLAERKAAAAKKELRESNLFNAKLLYVNKLMQSYDLNSKQQRAIVEALDNAKTLREAKLLYTSLTESLRKRRTSGSGKINEGALRAGSASKSTRSAAPAKNGMELDRWAVLAGINKPE